MKPRITFTHLLAAVLTTLLIVAMTLAAAFLLVKSTFMIAGVRNPILRAAAIMAELFLGVILLVGTVYMATHLAVRIFGGGRPQAGD